MQALERISFGDNHIKETVVAQSRILTFWYCATYLLMEKNKPKYQQLEAAPLEQFQPAAVQPIIAEKVEPNEAVTPKQVELEQPLESPPIDQDPPFVLEGL